MRFNEYKLTQPTCDSVLMSVGSQPLILAKRIERYIYEVSCIYPRPEFYAREIRLFLRCEFPELSYINIEDMVRNNCTYVTERLI